MYFFRSKRIGSWGEAVAARWLRKRHKILPWYRNWRTKLGGEIDFVGIKNRTVSLVEVKTRRLDLMHTYSALEAVDVKKLQQLERLKKIFIAAHRRTLQKLHIQEVKISVIGVYYSRTWRWLRVEVVEYRELD